VIPSRYFFLATFGLAMIDAQIMQSFHFNPLAPHPTLWLSLTTATLAGMALASLVLGIILRVLKA
jgi:hypothetical protein